MNPVIFSPVRLLFTLWAVFAWGHQAMAAPPANDAFANAAGLPGALPVTVPATNVEATAEVGEPLPEEMQSTVWWTWTAAASGWVKFSTAGAGADTVLAVYTGASVGGLTLIMSNDDGLLGQPPSDVIIPVQAGQTYRIQAGGFEGWTGTFDLSLTAYDTPPQVSSLVLSPLTADVTNQQVNVTGSIALTHPLGLADSALFVLTPEEAAIYDFSVFSGLTRISGTDTESTYGLDIAFYRYLPPGNYPILIQVGGANGEGATIYGRTSPLPPGLPKTITVANSGIVDTQPPEVVSVTPSATSVNVTTAAQTVTFTFRIVDQLSPLVDFSSQLFLRAPDLSDYASQQLSYHNRISGDYLDGTFSYTITIPAGSVPGDYSLGFRLRDQVNNVVNYGLAPSETPFPPGVPHTVTVVNTGGVDTVPPVLAGISASPATVNVAEFEYTEITVQATDALSGVEAVQCEYSFCGLIPVGGGPIVNATADFTRISGNGNNGTWRGRMYPPENTPPGDYRITGIILIDALFNVVGYGEDAAAGLIPFPPGAPAPVITIVSNPLPGPYRTWLAQYPSLQGADAARTADPDHDGYPNLVELALGLDPTLNSSPLGNDPAKANAPVISRSGNNIRMEYRIASANLGTGAKAITVVPVQTTDFQQWTNTSISVLGQDHYRASISITAGPQRWMRLEVRDPASAGP